MANGDILIIDDEKSVCEGCRMVLAEEGYTITGCLTGLAGLGCLEKNGYDLLLLDMKLPDVDGMEILTAAREAHPALPVIVMTGYSSVANAVQAMKKGAFDYLAKPFSDDELLLAAAKAIENKRLKEENLALRRQLFDRFDFCNIVGEHPKILKIFDQIRRVAPTESVVLIEGESGVGKELFAKAVHAHSPRSDRPFVAVDCSTIATSLLESELFGHVRGAFTGAVSDKPGIFEVAKGGTLFLDEISNLGMEVQGKLLRVLETREYRPVGAAQAKITDARIIAATNRDLKAMVDAREFREDLFYRLNVFPIYIPPLHERREDIPRLAYHFLKAMGGLTDKKIEGFSTDAMALLVHYEWPGNVRQLKNVIERLVIATDARMLDVAFVSGQLQNRREEERFPQTLEELKAYKARILKEQFDLIEKAFLIRALAAAQGNITHAAEQTGMQRSNFSALLRRYGIQAESYKQETAAKA